MARRRFRLALCTGGGDCPGLNAAIRGVVKNARGTHDMEVVGVLDGLTGLMHTPPKTRALDIPDVEGILAKGGTILGTSNQGSPFRDAASGKRALDAITKAIRAQKIDALIVIGGDGTQLMARSLSTAGIPVVGIPKTIDNDLVGSDQTIGFATAVEIASEAGARLLTSADAHDRIMVLEVMGRDAGHIALHAALACGAQIALIPEIDFDYALLAERVARRGTLGRHAMLAVVAEGAKARGEAASWLEAANGAKVLGGIGQQVARELHLRTGIDARAAVLGHVQRGGEPNVEDRLLAMRLACAAVDLIAAGDHGSIVGVRAGKVIKIPYAKVRDQRRGVDLKGELMHAAEASGISFGRTHVYRGLI